MIVLVSDTSACLTRQEAEEWGVTCIPLHYHLQGSEYEEIFSGENRGILPILRAGERGRTEPVSAERFGQVFGALCEGGNSVLCLPISSRLSRTYANACEAASRFAGKVAVLDSLAVGAQLKLLLERAVQRVREEKPLAEIMGELEALRDRVHTIFVPGSFEAVQRGGLVNMQNLSVSMLLNIKPLLQIRQGEISGWGAGQGSRDLIRHMLMEVPPRAEKILIGSYGRTMFAKSLCDEVRKTWTCPCEIVELGPVLGIHLGDNTAGISWLA